jgi:serine phosphatase RsbU (regulator of sigma subunit)
MDEVLLEQANKRVAAHAAAGHLQTAALEATLERSRKQIEDLALTAAELEASIPDQVGVAVREGFRTEVLPVGRQIAEMRGLLNQAIRRLERLEGELLAERYARVEDLELLVALVSESWRSLDARLDRSEQAQAEAMTRIIAAIEDLPAFDAEGKPVGHFAAA